MISRFFCLFAILVSTKIFANTAQQNPATRLFIELVDHAIQEIDEDRIYIDSSKIFFSKNRICLLNVLNEIIALPSIYSSENGLYIKVNDITFNIFNMWQCHVCRRLNHNSASVCKTCYTLRGEER